MKATLRHRLSPSLVLATLALAAASSGTAIAAGGRSDKPTATSNTRSVIGADRGRSAGALVTPRRHDGSLLPRLGR